jgi:hypothetical protein
MQYGIEEDGGVGRGGGLLNICCDLELKMRREIACLAVSRQSLLVGGGYIK